MRGVMTGVAGRACKAVQHVLTPGPQKKRWEDVLTDIREEETRTSLREGPQGRWKLGHHSEKALREDGNSDREEGISDSPQIRGKLIALREETNSDCPQRR